MTILVIATEGQSTVLKEQKQEGGGGKKLKMVARDLAITFRMLSAKYWQETLIPLQTIIL